MKNRKSGRVGVVRCTERVVEHPPPYREAREYLKTNKPNTKYYTKKYFKEKILVELQALEDVLEYSILHKLDIKINDKVVELLSKNFEMRIQE